LSEIDLKVISFLEKVNEFRDEEIGDCFQQTTRYSFEDDTGQSENRSYEEKQKVTLLKTARKDISNVL